MRTWAVLMAILLVSMLFFPVVSARQTTEHIQYLTINPDEDIMTWNTTFNMSDPASRSLSNYNQTIVPFMNNTSIEGVFTGTFMPPMQWQVSNETSFVYSQFMQLVRFKATWIMSGSSVSWWRVPVMNITDWDELSISIWRIGNPGLLELDVGTTAPNAASHPIWVYWETYWAEARNDTWYEQNVTAWDQEMKYYWLRVDAPIHADETYLVAFLVDASITLPGIRCQFAQTDVSDDQVYESHYIIDGEYFTLEADLDISVIHQYGMGHTVSGWEIEPGVGEPKTIIFNSRLSENVTNGEYVTFMMPFMKDISNASNTQVTISNINETWERSYWVAENGTTDFTISSWLWSESYSNRLFRLNVTFENQTNAIWVHDLYSDNYAWWHINYPDHRFEDRYPDFVNLTTASYRHLVWFRPYHSLQVTDGEWVNTVLDPVYYLDGRIVNMEDLRLKTTSHSDPWYVKWAVFQLYTLLAIYNIADFMLLDILPDLDAETLANYFSDAVANLKGTIGRFVEPIWVAVGWFAEGIEWLIDAASLLFAAVLKALSFVMFFVFFYTCLITNGTKRFFVIMSRDGPEVAAEYGSNFLKNSIKLAYKPVSILRGGR